MSGRYPAKIAGYPARKKIDLAYTYVNIQFGSDIGLPRAEGLVQPAGLRVQPLPAQELALDLEGLGLRVDPRPHAVLPLLLQRTEFQKLQRTAKIATDCMDFNRMH